MNDFAPPASHLAPRSVRTAIALIAFAMLASAAPRAWITAQAVVVLRIKVTILDADGRQRPVPRHALLISENPASATPRRVVTGLDGTIDVRLRPGNYTIESDEPLVFQGKAYEWAKTLDVPAGADTPLELTSANATIAAAAVSATPSAVPEAGSAAALLMDWQHSVVSIWSPTRLGAGFVIDARGLVATNQRLVGKATTVEVQISPTAKFAARVLAADGTKDIAILWIDPKAIASAPAMKLRDAPVAAQERIFTIDAPIDGRKTLSSGKVTAVTAQTIASDIDAEDDSLGGPVFNAGGEVVGLTSPVESASTANADSFRVVRIDAARAVIADAEQKLRSTPPPPSTPLPVEPLRAYEDDALKAAAYVPGRSGSYRLPYRITAAEFDVHVVTPLHLYTARHRGESAGPTSREPAAAPNEQTIAALHALGDFANWFSYVNDYPPVVMIRVTPKMVEGFWKALGRTAASTQGVELPQIKRMKSAFGRMRAFCGETELTPIHPLLIEHRAGGGSAIYEGLYVFDPSAIGPHCGTVKLMLYSDKEPDKPDTRIVDPRIVEQIWQDFALYRSAAR